jgi:hypothetical protein
MGGLTRCSCCGLLFGPIGLELHHSTSGSKADNGQSGPTEAIVSYTVGLAKNSIASGHVPSVPLNQVHSLDASLVSVASRSRDLQRRNRVH